MSNACCSVGSSFFGIIHYGSLVVPRFISTETLICDDRSIWPLMRVGFLWSWSWYSDLFSFRSCLKITHCETYSGRIWKDLEGLRASMQSSRYLISCPDENSTGCSYKQCFFCQNPVENCTQIFLRFDVNRDKSDVMTSFGMIDWSDICRVFRQAGSSLANYSFRSIGGDPDVHRGQWRELLFGAVSNTIPRRGTDAGWTQELRMLILI
jgi:hypothetical protein